MRAASAFRAPWLKRSHDLSAPQGAGRSKSYAKKKKKETIGTTAYRRIRSSVAVLELRAAVAGGLIEGPL